MLAYSGAFMTRVSLPTGLDASRGASGVACASTMARIISGVAFQCRLGSLTLGMGSHSVDQLLASLLQVEPDLWPTGLLAPCSFQGTCPHAPDLGL